MPTVNKLPKIDHTPPIYLQVEEGSSQDGGTAKKEESEDELDVDEDTSENDQQEDYTRKPV